MREWRDLAGQLREMASELKIRDNADARDLRADPPRAAHGARRQRRHEGAGRRPLPRPARPAVPRLAGIGAEEEPPALGDGGRAAGDHARLRAQRGAHRARLDREGRGAPRRAHLRRAALGQGARRGRRLRERVAPRPGARGAAQGELRAHRPGTRARDLHRGRAGRGRIRVDAIRSGRTTASSSARSRSSSIARAGPTCSWTTARSSPSTTRASRRTCATRARSTPGIATRSRKDPKLLFLSRDGPHAPRRRVRHRGALPARSCRWARRRSRSPIASSPAIRSTASRSTCPLALLNQVDEARVDWLVPGMVREKVALDDEGAAEAHPHAARPGARARDASSSSAAQPARSGIQRDSRQAVLDYASTHRRRAPRRRRSGRRTSRPPHLLMNIRVVDDAKRELAMGRDLAELRKRLGEAASLTLAKAKPGMEREGITSWDFGELPGAGDASAAATRRSRAIPRWWTRSTSVSIRLFDTKDKAAEAHRDGVKRLMALDLKEQVRNLDRALPGFNALALKFNAIDPGRQAEGRPHRGDRRPRVHRRRRAAAHAPRPSRSRRSAPRRACPP